MKLTMKFWRDDYTGPACLEYSWVPQGIRRTIYLEPGQQYDTRTDDVPDDLDATLVQVYRLNNNDAVSTEMWNFVLPPPPPPTLSAASVEVFQHNKYAVGTVHYANGTTATDNRPLDPYPRPCPEIPEGDKKS